MTNKEYLSVEQRIWEAVRIPIKNVVAGAYGFIAGIHRIPTTLRKNKNNQLHASRQFIESNLWKEDSFIYEGTRIIPQIIGGTISGASYVSFSYYALVNAQIGNWKPTIIQLGILGATNLVSLIYETHKK